MKLTVEDIYNFPEIGKMNLIAGKEGLGREVRACGILDYEFDSDVTDKYYDFNYRQEQFMTLTSFLYARDNDFLIMDAIKKLIAKGGSGLIIKNVFNLTIHENVIKYADYMKFPIFLLVDNEILFEDIIILIAKKVEHYKTLEYQAGKADKLLTTEDRREIKQLAYEINPSLKNDLIAVYFQSKERPFAETTYFEREKMLFDTEQFTQNDSVFYYKNGIMIIKSADIFPRNDDLDCFIEKCVTAVNGEKMFKVGISSIHHFLLDIGEVIRESEYAAALHLEDHLMPWRKYDNLGTYRVLLPQIDNPELKKYSSRYMNPIADYDAENKGALLYTAIVFVESDGDIGITAGRIGQHQNTVRNRLSKIGELTGLNILSFGGYEQLALAVKIYICRTYIGIGEQ